MAEHPNAARLREIHEAFMKGDTLQEPWTEDVVYHVAGKSPMAGDHKGPEAVLALLKGLFEIPGGSMTIEAHDFLGSDEHSVALYRMRASRPGKELDANFCEVAHWRDGRIAEDWGFAFDQYAFDDFWS